jgi:Glycosyl hydrolases family 43
VRRRRAPKTALLWVCLAAALVASACQPPPPLGIVTGQSVSAPQWPMLADPSVMADGGRYYLFSSTHAGFRMPVYVVDSLATTYTDLGAWIRSTREGMPANPPWAVDNRVFWAPTVARAGNGSYVAFFAAQRTDPPSYERRMCIGRAVATSPEGPYVPEPVPFSCGFDGVTGAIDPSLFRGPDGTWYLHASFTSTPGHIYSYVLDGNLDQQRSIWGTACCYYEYMLYAPSLPWETTWIENPSMAYDASTNTYLLSYSAGASWTSPNHATGLARCSTPVGMCTPNQSGPWLAKSAGRTGTGGFSFFVDADGSTKGVYASFAAGTEPNGPRGATATGFSFGSSNPTLFPLTP